MNKLEKDRVPGRCRQGEFLETITIAGPESEEPFWLNAQDEHDRACEKCNKAVEVENAKKQQLTNSIKMNKQSKASEK